MKNLSSTRRFPLIAPRYPARRVVTRSGSMPRGYFPSLKNDDMVAFEQLLEGDAVALFEMSPFIRSYVGQPEKIYYPDGDRTRFYIPDYEVELVDGSRVLIEIKPQKRLDMDDVKHKFQCVREHMDRLGRAFTILTERAIRQQPRLQNLRVLLRDVPLNRLTPDAVRRSLRALSKTRVGTLGEASALVGKETVFTLLHQGYATCPLTCDISPSTAFYLTSEIENEWFLITEGYGF